MGMPEAIPVIMYHSVGPEKDGFRWNHLITPLDVFEAQMEALAERGWKTITLRQLYDHISKGTSVPERSVVLTFDDGYLDNWVFAYPILKKYGHHAVVWMSTDFVNPEGTIHPTLEDVWSGKLPMEGLENRGYLSWEEMKLMVRDGVFEIQSHAKTHTWYFSSPRIVDFHRPNGVDGYMVPIWLVWNRFPERKYKSMEEDLSDKIPYGTPIYEHGKALAVKRYFEDEGLTRALVGYVHANGGSDFFHSPGWRQKLIDVVSRYDTRNDRIESEEEYLERVRHELTESKKLIEENLGVKVEFLCWPGGGRNEKTKKIAVDVGYLATTSHFQDPVRKNVFGQNPEEINRIGPASPWFWKGKIFKRTGKRFFINSLESFCGSRVARFQMRLLKLWYIVRWLFFGRS